MPTRCSLVTIMWCAAPTIRSLREWWWCLPNDDSCCFISNICEMFFFSLGAAYGSAVSSSVERHDFRIFSPRETREISQIFTKRKRFLFRGLLERSDARHQTETFPNLDGKKWKFFFAESKRGKINVHTRSLADDDDLITECVSSSTPDALRMWNMANDGGKWRNPSHVSLILILLLHEKQKRQKPTLNVHTAAKRACSMANREISDCIVYAMLAFMSRRKRSRQENKRR